MFTFPLSWCIIHIREIAFAMKLYVILVTAFVLKLFNCFDQSNTSKQILSFQCVSEINNFKFNCMIYLIKYALKGLMYWRLFITAH